MLEWPVAVEAVDIVSERMSPNLAIVIMIIIIITIVSICSSI